MPDREDFKKPRLDREADLKNIEPIAILNQSELIEIIKELDKINDNNPEEPIQDLHIISDLQSVFSQNNYLELLKVLAESRLLRLFFNFTVPSTQNPNLVATRESVVLSRNALANQVNALRNKSTQNPELFQVAILKEFDDAYNAVQQANLDNIEGNSFSEKFFTLYWQQYWLHHADETNQQNNPEIIQKIQDMKQDFINIVELLFNKVFGIFDTSLADSAEIITTIQKNILKKMQNRAFDKDTLLTLHPDTALRINAGQSVSPTSIRVNKENFQKSLEELFRSQLPPAPTTMTSGRKRL